MHTLTTQEMPVHSHTLGGGGSFFMGGTFVNGPWFTGGGSGVQGNAISYTTDNSGGGWAHNILPRFVALAYIMKL